MLNKLFILLVSKAGCNNDGTSRHVKKKNLVRMKKNVSYRSVAHKYFNKLKNTQVIKGDLTQRSMIKGDKHAVNTQ